MASRGATGTRPGTGTISRPRPTRSQMLRQAKNKNVAVVVPEAQAEPRKAARPREGLAKLAPPPAPPRKVLFSQPKMTKAMLARQAKAQEKIQEDERKKAALEARKRPGRRSAPAAAPRRAAPRSPQRQEAMVAAAAEILEESRQSAKSGNAEVIKAIPVGDGEIGAIIIPPGVVNEEQMTIVEIVQPEEVEEAPAGANRSLQAISNSLTEQENAEAAAVQDRLDEFQQARRDFIMELASVTAPGVDPDLSVLDIDRLPIGEFDVEPSPPRRRLQRIPPPDDPMFHLEYGRDHPAIIAAREFRLRKDQQRRFEDKFHRVADDGADSFDLDAPLYHDIQDADVSFEEDEFGEMMPCKSRVKAPMPRAQRAPRLRPEAMYYPHSTFRQPDIDELERFFNIERYPNIHDKNRPPSGREALHRDLWELEDPWYREATPPEMPDLMEFSR